MKIAKIERRNLLKFLLIGGGLALAGKVFGPRILSFFSGSGSKTEYDFGSFRLSDDKKALIISDRNGEEILIIDKQ